MEELHPQETHTHHFQPTSFSFPGFMDPFEIFQSNFQRDFPSMQRGHFFNNNGHSPFDDQFNMFPPQVQAIFGNMGFPPMHAPHPHAFTSRASRGGNTIRMSETTSFIGGRPGGQWVRESHKESIVNGVRRSTTERVDHEVRDNSKNLSTINHAQ